jgi:hypothetical protein
MQIPYDFFCVLLDKCLMRFHVFFFAVMRFPCESSCFLLHIVFNIRVSKVTTMEC